MRLRPLGTACLPAADILQATGKPARQRRRGNSARRQSVPCQSISARELARERRRPPRKAGKEPGGSCNFFSYRQEFLHPESNSCKVWESDLIVNSSCVNERDGPYPGEHAHADSAGRRRKQGSKPYSARIQGRASGWGLNLRLAPGVRSLHSTIDDGAAGLEHLSK